MVLIMKIFIVIINKYIQGVFSTGTPPKSSKYKKTYFNFLGGYQLKKTCI